MNRNLTKQRAIARMKMTTVSTRAGRKKPSYELNALLPIEAPLTARDQKPTGESSPPGDDKPQDEAK